MSYLHWDEKTITDFSEKNIADMYDRGYVFTRIGKGVMHQTRSVRVDLAKFELTSENRRVLKKVDGLTIRDVCLPLTENPYDFKTGKLAKDFYEQKFGSNIMSAQKIKEMLTDAAKSNFNALLEYSMDGDTSGYAIIYACKRTGLIHYSYPFYDLNAAPKDMGLGMMITAIDEAKRDGLKYVYLGSLQRPGDTYKLQFEGLEWFDGGPDGSGKWRTDTEAVKKVLAEKTK